MAAQPRGAAGSRGPQPTSGGGAPTERGALYPRSSFASPVAGPPQAIEDFVSGFLIQGGAATFGRAAGLTIAPDGALLFTEDTNGIVYRVQAD